MILIQNARVMDPKTKLDKITDILIRDDVIEEMGIIRMSLHGGMQ